ncbi:LysR family transcriptional regulator [Curvibacter sp. APW13]|uniref:LysR family transcriptional regulator n=1 Tax=Curvibacter sp. APW13 TaxID=3077236 RepID=UPI0028DD5566|nr:LysR family transcriptional regulator [Curvibacter sp. APW13]MDT8990248.1 LysR family transcriptional regulator [Curvibacter sp. APW13]
MDRLLSMRVFERVLAEGSFSAAARALDLSPAVVTRLVADLEEHLGTRLLQRSTRKLSLTDAGEQYLARLHGILQDIDDAEALASTLTQQARGTLRVLAQPVLATHVLAPLVAGFAQRYPDILLDLQVRAFKSPPIEDYDLTIFGAPANFDGDIIARKIVSARAILVASPQYLRAHGSPQSPQDLQRHRFLQLHADTMLPPIARLQRIDAATPPEAFAVRPLLRSNHVDTLLQAALDGAGITGASLELVAAHLAKGTLVHVLPQWMLGELVMYAALPTRKFLPQRTRVFLDYLTEHTQRAVVRASRMD